MRYFYKYFSVSPPTEGGGELSYKRRSAHCTHSLAHTGANASADMGPLTMQHPASPGLRWKNVLATLPNAQSGVTLAAQIQRGLQPPGWGKSLRGGSGSEISDSDPRKIIP